MTEDQKLQLDALITREEALLALLFMLSGKAPGPDGFACFIRSLAVFSWTRCCLCSIIHLKMGSCLNSSGKPTFLSFLKRENVRRAVPHTGQKLLSKIPALRLEKVLPYIVSEDQTGFVKGQISCDNMRRLLHIIHLTQSHGDLALMLSS